MTRHLVDLDTLNLSGDAMPEEQLRALLPHRHEFQLIDGVCHLDVEEGLIVAYKDWDEDPWWARGHVPGRPLMPGVLMCEGCAQASTIMMKAMGWAEDSFVGLGGLEDVRFRGTVVPPKRVHFVSRLGSMRKTMARNPAQTFVDGKMIMEMVLIGVVI